MTEPQSTRSGFSHGGDTALILVGVLLLVAGIAVLVAMEDGHLGDDSWDDCWCY